VPFSSKKITPWDAVKVVSVFWHNSLLFNSQVPAVVEAHIPNIRTIQYNTTVYLPISQIIISVGVFCYKQATMLTYLHVGYLL
jgi:hypothetical protein